MLLSEIIYNIKNLKAGGVSSDDEKISDRQWAFIINYYRATIIRQDSRNVDITQDNIQNLGKVDLIEVDPSSCGCEGYACVLRTKDKIPATITLKSRPHGFTFVGEIGLDAAEYQETTYSNVYWDNYRKYTKALPRWFLQDGYIYIVNPRGLLSYINIQGIFEDPTAANKFKTCDCESNEMPCNIGFDYDYPFKAQYMDRLMAMIANQEMKLSAMFPQDRVNDGIDPN